MYRVLVAQTDSVCEANAIQEFLAVDPKLSCDLTSLPELDRGTRDLSAVNLVVVVAPSADAQDAILKSLGTQRLGAPVLAALPAGATERWLNTTSKTTDDFIVDPFNGVELRHRVAKLLGRPEHTPEGVRRRMLDDLSLSNLVGQDPVFTRAIQQLPRFARTDLPVCITGETGTGKELCARALHHLSPRQAFPFIGIDCGALPEQLFENEIFGHARGAFTDAHRDQKGLVAMAEGGTLFLDEIDALSLSSQAKLLRFLQDRSYRALGSDKFESANVRVIAATNRDLEAAVRAKQFRQDLFFRLNVLRLRLPPLRERRGDVRLLAFAALRDYSAVDGESGPEFSPSALDAMALHDWPGNVRELYNVVQRAVIAAEDGRILPEHLDLPTMERNNHREAGADFRAMRAAAVATFERRYVEDLLRKHNGNVTHAAREAQQDRRAFGRFIKKYNIDRRTLTA